MCSGDLQDIAELFCTSVRLQDAATGLKKIIDGQQISSRDAEDFEWAGNLLGRMDWNSEHYEKGEHPELSLIATDLRPTFYRTITMYKIPFDAKFSEDFYETLKSYGKTVKLGRTELRQAHQIFESLAAYTLNELTNRHH